MLQLANVVESIPKKSSIFTGYPHTRWFWRNFCYHLEQNLCFFLCTTGPSLQWTISDAFEVLAHDSHAGIFVEALNKNLSSVALGKHCGFLSMIILVGLVKNPPKKTHFLWNLYSQQPQMHWCPPPQPSISKSWNQIAKIFHRSLWKKKCSVNPVGFICWPLKLFSRVSSVVSSNSLSSSWPIIIFICFESCLEANRQKVRWFFFRQKTAFWISGSSALFFAQKGQQEKKHRCSGDQFLLLQLHPFHLWTLWSPTQTVGKEERNSEPRQKTCHCGIVEWKRQPAVLVFAASNYWPTARGKISSQHHKPPPTLPRGFVLKHWWRWL